MTREEAIEVYNGLINTKIKEAFEFFAPELRESEDERVRKFICSIIDNLEPKDFVGVKKMNVLAWLEKHEECVADSSKTSSDEEERIRKGLEILVQNAVYPGLITEQESKNYLSWLEKQKEQKQEWGEEDVLMLKCCRRALEFYQYNAKRYTNGITLPAQFDIAGYLTTPGRVLTWLKSLRPQPKQRWTMEDLSMLCDIAGYVDGSGSSSGITNQERVDFLYKLPKRFNLPQLHWKPSEEQMEALKHYVDTTTDGEIDLLYNDLKKLTED